MKLYFTDYKGGSRRELTLDEAREHLSEAQIEEGREAILADHLEDAFSIGLTDAEVMELHRHKVNGCCHP